MYDVLIKNGRVIDCSTGTDEIKNVAIKDGVFTEYKDGEEVKKMIDASGCIVAPGFIDAHTHLFYGGTGLLSTKADISCLPNCVTTACDAGSTSIWNFESFYKTEIMNSMTNIIAMLHPCITGVQLPPTEEIENPEYFNEEEIIKFFKKYPHVLRGLKIRMSKGTAGAFGVSPIRRTAEIAEAVRNAGHHCMITCHYSDLADGVTMREFMDCFKEGDVVSHMYHPDGDSIFNPDGTVMDSVLEARQRGVLFDSSRARINFSIKNILKGAEQNFYPDIMSTDLAKRTLYYKPSFSILWSMSLFLNVGMTENDIIKAVTYTPAKAFGILDKAGTMQEGKTADVAIIKIIDKERIYADLFGDKIYGKKLVVPMATIREGNVVFQQIFMDDELS